MRILFKLPSRSRPEAMFSTIDNVFEMSTTDGVRLMLTLDIDDSTVANREVLERIKRYGDKVDYHYGYSKSKVDSINRDILLAKDFDILIAHADDMVIVKKGFDEIIVNDMKNMFPDTDGLLHYLDGTPAKDQLVTWPVMGKSFFRRFNYIYHPSYASVFCDDEQTCVAKKLNCYKFINRQLVDHQHPVWQTREWDDLYRRNEEPIQYHKDFANYKLRLANNFDLQNQ